LRRGTTTTNCAAIFRNLIAIDTGNTKKLKQCIGNYVYALTEITKTCKMTTDAKQVFFSGAQSQIHQQINKMHQRLQAQ